jgi:hypothetical protein
MAIAAIHTNVEVIVSCHVLTTSHWRCRCHSEIAPDAKAVRHRVRSAVFTVADFADLHFL